MRTVCSMSSVWGCVCLETNGGSGVLHYYLRVIWKAAGARPSVHDHCWYTTGVAMNLVVNGVQIRNPEVASGVWCRCWVQGSQSWWLMLRSIGNSSCDVS